jgi:hypothetical protein
MAELWEAILPAGTLSSKHDRYEIHTALERETKLPSAQQARAYLWDLDPVGGRVIVRSSVKCVNTVWSPVTVPEAGQQVGFRLTTSPRMGSGKKKPPNSSETRLGRRPVKGVAALSMWAFGRLTSAGITISDVEVIEQIAKVPDKLRQQRRQMYATFIGKGVVNDAALLSDALTRGIGNAKYLGFGMLHIKEKV